MKGPLSTLRAKALRQMCQRAISALLHPLTLLLVAFACNTLLWAAVTNLGNPPDEFSHFDYIRHLAISHRLPIYGETRYIDTNELQAHASLPPLYYLLGAPLQMVLSRSTVTKQMLALRALSVLFGAITVALVYMFGRMLAPRRPVFAFAMAMLVGFNPMFTYLCASINSDNLINLIYAALILLLAYMLRQHDPSRRLLIGLGALLGVGLLTKPTILIGVLVSALVIFFLAWKERPRFLLALIRYGLWTSSIALLISGWILVRNWLLYGNPFGLIAGRRTEIFPLHPYRDVGSLWQMIFATGSDSLPFFPTVLRSFWGIFDHLEILMPSRIYDIMTALLLGGLIGAALWVASSWKNRSDTLTGQRLLLGGIGGLIFILSFLALLYLCYRLDNEPQGRYLFAALSPLAAGIVGGWEHLGGLIRVRWLAAPLIILLVLTVNVVGLVRSLAPTHHDRYLGRLLSDKQAEAAEGETYAKDHRYVPKLPLVPEPTLRPVYDTSPVEASFVAEHTQIERLEMLLNVPRGARGPLIWKLIQPGGTGDLLEAMVSQPLAGPACYRIDVSSCHFQTGQAYTLRLETPDITARQPILAALTEDGAPDSSNDTDLKLQIVYAGVVTKQAVMRADYLLRSDAPNSLRACAQRVLYPLDLLLLSGLAAVTLARVMVRFWRAAIVVPISGLMLACIVMSPESKTDLFRTYEIAPVTDLRPDVDSGGAEPVFAGFQDSADCGVTGGWAWNANEPNTPINVDIYDEGALVATISANVLRADLVKSGFGNGYHGFVYFFDNDKYLKDGRPHSIRVRFAGTNIDLSNTPKSISCSQTAEVPRAKNSPR